MISSMYAMASSQKCSSSTIILRRLPRQAANVSVRLQFDGSLRQPAVEIAPAHNRPPVIEENLDRPPIGDPGDDNEALLEKASDRHLAENARDQLRYDEGDG